MKRTWWTAVYCDKATKTATFVFVDNGIGIFESAKIKQFKLQIGDSTLFGKSNTELLREILFNKRHVTATELSYRGKGLKSIKRVLDRKQINNLIVITNDVYADVGRNNYKQLPNQFSGTLFLWEVKVVHE